MWVVQRIDNNMITFIFNYQNSGVGNCLLPIQCGFVIDYGNIDIIDRHIYIFSKFKLLNTISI